MKAHKYVSRLFINLSTLNMEKQYRILITERDYSAWHLAEDDTYVPTATPSYAFSDPAKHKLFSRDIITISELDGIPRIVHSPT